MSRIGRGGGWHTFAEDHSFSDGTLRIISRLCEISLSTYKERRDAGRKPFVSLVQGMIDRGEDVSSTIIDEMNRFKAEIEAEKNGVGIERG